MHNKATSGAARKHVLVVEDDYDARSIYEATLLYAGYDATCTRTLAQAAKAATLFRPDIVVLDCRLPDGNGLDLLKRWKSSDDMRKVPVVVITAFSQPEHVDAATAAGADAFVVKPCPGEALTSFLARVLASSTPTRRVPKFRMSTRISAPPVVIPCGKNVQTATLHRIDALHFQARCDGCLRPSPVVEGEVRDALKRVIELGWATAGNGGWSCPICHNRHESRNVTGVRRRPSTIPRDD